MAAIFEDADLLPCFTVKAWTQEKWLSSIEPRDPFLERPEHFSGPKNHFKNHEAFYVQSFLVQQVLHLSKAYTYAAFRI